MFEINFASDEFIITIKGVIIVRFIGFIWIDAAAPDIVILAVSKEAEDVVVDLGKVIINEPRVKTITIVINGIRVDYIINVIVAIATDKDDFTIKMRDYSRENRFLIINSSTNRLVQEMLKEISKKEFKGIENDQNFSSILLKRFNHLREAAYAIKDKILSWILVKM